MKTLFFSLVLLLLALAGCRYSRDPARSAVWVDSLAQQMWERDLATGRAVNISGGKSILPRNLYAGSRENFFQDSAYFSDLIQKLDQLEPDHLPVDKKTDYDLLRWTAEIRLQGTQYYGQVFPPVTPYANFLYGIETVFKQASLDTPAEAAQYILLLKQYRAVQQTYRDKLRWMASRGTRMGKPQLEVALGMITRMRVPPEQHPLFPADARLTRWADTARASFQANARKILLEEILPQHDSLSNYLKGDYYQQSSDQVGLSQYPGGTDYYRYLVRFFTTTDLTPEAIYELGLRQVNILARQLDSIRLATGFTGDRKTFYHFLQTDRRFLALTPEEAGERLKRPLRRVDSVIHRLISLRPHTGYDIRRLSPELEPVMTFGKYEPPAGEEPLGVYYFNGSKLDQRPMTNAAGLALQELIPGHHWQGRLQAENKNLSDFRKNQFIWAFSEGWASYASSRLGRELGMYADPYDYCGRLLMDMFISVRLVVDVGMNHLGWSREQAIAYMREHVIESEQQIRSETLRYSCDIPGQALSYKIGALQLEKLRDKYERASGDHWNVVRFHDVVLANGALPFSVLEKVLDREFAVR